MRIRRRPSLLVLAAVVVAIVLTGRTPISASPGMRAAAAVSWPPSASLVISELQTGGVSASDEFVEIANVGPVTADLAGFELVGASSSGATVARRVAWTAATPIGPGRHLLVANAAGIWASIADATYASGLAAAGGAVALRLTGGAVVDAVGWGDAVNGFVEGAAAPAPPAGSSIERLPGGDLGNATDTNDDAADWTARAVPAPQRLADPPTPLPTPTPVDSPTPSPTDPPGSPVPSMTPVPTPTATTTASPAPTVSPSVSPTPTPAPTPSPSATAAPTPTPTPTLSPPPTPTPTPAPIAIADARRLADGDAVRIEGTLTTALGALDGDRTGFVQDTTGGIALYLDAAAAAALPAGTLVRVAGTLDHRYGLTVVRVQLSDVVRLGDAALPAAATTSTGGAGADREGSRIVVTGTIADIAGTLADGLGVDLDDGSGPLRVIVDPSVLGAYTPMKGDRVEASGPLGRRDGSTGTGYRLHATLAGSFIQTAPAPTPTPSPAPSASPTPTASPSPAPSSTPSPTPSPFPSPSPSPTVRPTPSPTATPGDRPVVSIAAARASAVGTRVRIRAVVTAPPGRLWSDRMGALQDASGGIFVRFRTDDAAPVLGAQVDVAGTLVRSGARVILRADERWSAPPSGTDPVATPAAIDPGAAIDRAGEGRLVTVAGTVAKGATARPDGHVVFVVVTASGVRFGVTGRPGSGIGAALVRAGTGVRVTGVGAAGGAPAAGRIWLRAAGDVVRSAAAAPTSTGGSATSGEGPSPTPVGIGTLAEGAAATVEGVVTAGPGLLTPVGRAIRIEDASGAIDVLTPAGHAGSGPAAGTRVLVTGTVVALKAGLRIRATELRATGSGSVPVRSLASAPGAADIGRIARVTGTVASLRRSGATWRAEVGIGSATVLVTAVAAAAIPSTRLAVGAHVRVTGLVLAAPASGADRRPRIAPRGPSDVVLVSAGAVIASASAGAAAGTASGSAVGSASAGGATGGAAGPASIGDAILPPLRSAAQLVAAAAGESVLVSGVVRGASAGAILVDDGTGIAHVALRGAAASVAETVAAGDGLQAAGTTERDAAGTVAVVVDDPASIVRAGAPGGAGDAATVDPAISAAGSAGGAATGPDAGGVSLPATTSTGIGIAAVLGSGDPAADGTAGASAASTDPLPLLLAVVAGCVGAAAAALLRRRRTAAPDPAVVRRLAQLGAGPVLPARGTTGSHLDAALGTGLSSRPTGAGQARST